MVLSSREKESVLKISQSKSKVDKYQSDIMYVYIISHGEEIQHVLINEIDVDKEHSNTMQQLIHELVAAPVVAQSRNSPHIAKCFGPFTNSKVSDCLSQLIISTVHLFNISNLLTAIFIGYQNLACH